jgi:Glyoxalase-like domain
MATAIQVVFDCTHPGELAAFWATALHYQFQPPPEGFDTWEDALRAWNFPEELFDARSAVVDPEGKGPRIFFQKVPEAKSVKNRVHLDLNVGGGPEVPDEERRPRIDAEAERLRDAGATVFRRAEENGEYWVVMQDPEGNEFCVQ